MFNLLILESRPLYAESLKEFFQKFKIFNKIKCIDKIEECIKLLKQDNNFSVILICKLQKNFNSFVNKIKEIVPSIKILYLYDPEIDILKEEFLNPLIDGYISVEWGISELKNALFYLQKGEKIFPRTFLTNFISNSFNERNFLSHDIFTPQEFMILKMICKGKINKEIASALGIKEKTVKNYLSKIYFKLKVKRKAEAILKAVSLGVV
ncbi:MAG: response regulator transcription factor [Elusimicrobiota bacterium]|nr:response regulator transcription factor [Endomicrobiia bacterium]MDW8165685.1 response regulator transcription factor [Elusimicrobiota bacterium]